MSSGDWLSKIDPAPPAELATAMRNAVLEAQGASDGGDPTPELLLHAGETLLHRVLTSDCEKRAAALDLLAVDALITYSLELASRDPDVFEDFPGRVLERMKTMHAHDEKPGRE